MSKSEILNAIKKHQPPLSLLPTIPLFPKSTVDQLEQFLNIASKSGTNCYSNKESLEQVILANFSKERIIVAPAYPEINNRIIDEKTTVERLRDIGLVILEATLAVAENGALWLAEKDCPHRVLPFITQHLILLVKKEQIVQNMHEAYQKISVAQNSFGVFIAGPSKTADIEQSLVIGAQGARSLTVMLIE